MDSNWCLQNTYVIYPSFYAPKFGNNFRDFVQIT